MATAPYVINPDDPTQPTENLTMGAAAAELRGLKQRVLLAREETADLETRALTHEGANPYELDAQLNANGNKITELPTATDASDATPLAQVLALIQERLGFLSQITWAPGLAIEATPTRQWTVVAGQAYVATSNHIAGATFAADLAAGRWLALDVAQVLAALASNASGKGADLVANQNGGTVQDYIDRSDLFFAAMPSLSDGSPSAVAAAHPLGKIRVPVGTNTVSDLQLYGQCLDGQGLGAVLKAGVGATTAVKLGYINTPGQWARKSIRDLVIDGNTKLSDGATFAAAASTEISGRWKFDGVVFKGCKKGAHKPAGNIGNSFDACNFIGNDYGVYAVGQSAPLMHAGCDTYTNTEFSSNALAGAYYDSPQIGSGGLVFGKNTIFETNPGFGVFIKNWTSSYTPVVFDGVWFEGNATAGSVTINGTDYVPVDIHLENVAQAVIRDGVVPKVRLINSRLHVDNCLIEGGLSSIEADAASVLTVSNAQVDGGNHKMEIQSVTQSRREAGNFAGAWWAPARSVFVSDAAGKVLSQPFTSAANFVGTAAINGVVVSDGRIYASSNELTVPASHSLYTGSASLTSGKWAVLTIDVKHVSGNLAQLQMGHVLAQNLIGNYAPLLVTGKWKTIACIAKVAVSGATAIYLINGAGGTQVLRFSAAQVLEFDTQQEAVDYYNGRGFAL